MAERKKRGAAEASAKGNAAGHVGRLGDLLLKKGILSREQIAQIALAQSEQNLRFGDAAVSLGFLTQIQLDQALGEQFGYSFKDLINGQAHPSLSFLHAPFSKEAEQIRSLRSELLLKFYEQEKIRVAVISAGAGEGKSYLAASLAIALSQVGKRTLLIDADLRSGKQHHYFGLAKPDGLSSVMAQRLPLEEALIQIMPNLYLLPAGPRPPNALEILRPPRVQQLQASCEEQFDAFVIDTYTAALASDAQMVAHQVGKALLVARKDQTRVDVLRQICEDMAGAGVEVIGTVFNQFETGQDSVPATGLARWKERIARLAGWPIW